MSKKPNQYYKNGEGVTEIVTDESGKDLSNFITTRTLDELRANPEAFLLSEAEDVLVTKARQVLQILNDKYKDVAKKDFDRDVKAQFYADFISQAKAKRLPITKLKNLVYKFQGSQYWTVLFIGIEFTDDDVYERQRLITSNPDVRLSHDNIIDMKTCPEYYKATTRAEKAKALNIPDLFYYIPAVELDTLSILTALFKYESDLQKSPAVKVEDDLFFHVINTPQLNALWAIGQNSKNPDVKKGHDEKGKNISIAEYATNIGVTLSFKDFNPFDTGNNISIGEPNADKLLMQSQLICMKTGCQSFEISLTEFMKFRKISDRKSAIEQAGRACETLLKASYKINAENESVSLRGGINYVQECYVKTKGKNSGRGGNTIYINLSDKLYQHIINYSKKGDFIEQIDKRIASIPNNQQTAYNIFKFFGSNCRINSDKPTSHRLSVQRLLDYCPALPLYPAKDEDIGKEYYLRFRSEARDRIITPFIKALDYLVDKGFFSEYTLTHSKGKPLTNAELIKVYDDYSLFVSLNVDVVFTNEPDYKLLNENKAKQKAKNEKTSTAKSKQSKKRGA